jgi:hypothetical protein
MKIWSPVAAIAAALFLALALAACGGGDETGTTPTVEARNETSPPPEPKPEAKVKTTAQADRPPHDGGADHQRRNKAHTAEQGSSQGKGKAEPGTDAQPQQEPAEQHTRDGCPAALDSEQCAELVKGEGGSGEPSCPPGLSDAECRALEQGRNEGSQKTKPSAEQTRCPPALPAAQCRELEEAVSSP